jgi:hypothetical protein
MSSRWLALCLALLVRGIACADTVDRSPTGDGTFTGTWSGSAGSRYQAVDDYPDSTGTDSLTHGTTAGSGRFTRSAFAIAEPATITSVAILYYDQKSGSASSAARSCLTMDGGLQCASTHNPSNGTWVSRTDTWTTNPLTGAPWTVAQVNGTAGTNDLDAEVTLGATDASPTILFSSVIIRVTYTPATAPQPSRVRWFHSQAQSPTVVAQCDGC